ncbi:MAG TPA: hypothetical protein DGT21_25710 [Armatimonadetes bacterium]|nr:hypothetical protein [Armatimonadota bacterium]
MEDAFMSRHSCPPLTALLVATLCIPCLAMEIVTDGRAVAAVVIPDEPLPVVQFAAEELVYHVKRATGAELAVVAESAMPADAPVIVLGGCRASAEAGLGFDGTDPNAWTIRLTDDRLYMLGDDSDGPAAWILHGNRTRVGTLFAVYSFLEQRLDVKWLWPGELGEVIPPTDDIAVDAWNETSRPAFVHTRWRDGGAILTGEAGWAAPEARSRFLNEQGKWLRRHRFALGRNMDMAHAFTTWWDRYHETHPEYFNLLPDGTRRSDATYHGGAPSLISMSVGDPAFQRAVVDDWLQRRTPEKPWLDCSENDTCGKCMCEHCMALDVPDPSLDFPWEERADRARTAFLAGDPAWYRNLGSLSDRYARYYLAVLEAARKHDPEAVVMGYAYANYVDPPLETKLNSSIIVGVVPPMYYPWTDAKRQANRDRWLGWYEAGPRMFLRPNWMLDGHNMPLFLARKLGDDFRFYASHSLIGTDFDSLTGQYAAQGPNLYMLARLHEEPTVEVETVLDEYYSAFGPAEQAVRDYFAHWERVADTDHTQPATEAGTGQRAADDDQGEQIEGLHWSYFYRQAHVIFTPEAMAEGRALIDRALGAAGGDELATRRVTWLQHGLHNAELTLATQRAYVKYREDGDFESYRDAVGALDEFRASVEGELIGNMSFLANREAATWDRRLIELMAQPGERIPDPWKFAWDPDGTGVEKRWFADDLDTSTWLDIGTNGPWEEQAVGRKWRQEHREDYNGLAWYRTSFTVAQDPNRPRVMLVFGSVDEACMVWVNGEKLLERPYPYQGNADSWKEAFEVDITDVVRHDRPNTVAVQVSDNSGVGGVWRPVWINRVALPAAAETNLVQGAGFEGEPGAWGKSIMAGKFIFAIDTSHANSGASSGRLECTAAGTEEDKAKYRTDIWGRWHQSIGSIDPAKTYRFRAWVRTSADFNGQAALWVTNTEVGTASVNVLNTRGRWHEAVIEDIRPKGDTVGVYLNLMHGTGTVWFDDVELVDEGG